RGRWCGRGLVSGVRLRRTSLAGPSSGAGAELARSASPRLAESAALKQLRPCLPARRPGGGPNEPPRSPSTGQGLTVGWGGASSVARPWRRQSRLRSGWPLAVPSLGDGALGWQRSGVVGYAFPEHAPEVEVVPSPAGS